MVTIRVPSRARSSSSLASPTRFPSSSFSSSASSSALPSPTTPTFPAMTTARTTASSIPIATTTSTTSKPKPRRPSLPIMSSSTSMIPTQRSFQSTSASPSQLLQPSTSRTSKGIPRPSFDRTDNALSPSSIVRPSSAMSSPRTLSSPRLASSSKFGGDSSRPLSAASSTGGSSYPHGAKPVSKTQKTMGIKPPSIVTKPNSGNSKTSALPPIAPSPMPPSSSSAGSGAYSISPITGTTGSVTTAPPALPVPTSPSTALSGSGSIARSRNRLHAGVDSACFMTRSNSSGSSASSSSPSPSSTPVMASTMTMQSDQSLAVASVGASPSLSSPMRHFQALAPSGAQKGACPPAPVSTSRKIISRRPSAAADIPTAYTPAPNHVNISSTHNVTIASASISAPSSAVPAAIKSRARAGSISHVAHVTSSSTSVMSANNNNSNAAIPSPKQASSSISTMPTTITTTNTISTPTTPSPLKSVVSMSSGMESTSAESRPGRIPEPVQCQCPPPLEFPENVKREMKREEEEHRERECGLYAKIIELQIENANLKGEKETLNRVVGRRDQTLLEMQIQLQAMEFVCRENEIKVDINMCPDEAIENWSFKESDEVYQRILLTTQDLLRTGSKCLEETMMMTRSSSQHQRSTRSSSLVGGGSVVASYPFEHTQPLNHFPPGVSKIRGNAVAGISEGAQPLVVQDQEVDPLVFKETSRPGTLKFDIQTLLRSEQEFVNQSKTSMETGRRAQDLGDRAGFLQSLQSMTGMGNGGEEDEDDEDSDDDDDEGQASEFEELGEDMIKYVELQTSGAPRRDSRSSMSKGTPDMSTAVLMKNLWSMPRRSSGTTPIHHPASGYYNGGANRSSGGSTLSNNSLLDDYFVRAPPPMNDSACHLPATVGLGLVGLTRSPEQFQIEKFGQPTHHGQLLSAPPTGPLPPPSPHSHPMARSPMSNSSSATFSYSPCTATSSPGMGPQSTIRPPPMTPLPPLPPKPRYSYRDHTTSKLLEPRKPRHGRTCSHGFTIENVGLFLKRKMYGKTLTRESLYRGHRRRDSV